MTEELKKQLAGIRHVALDMDGTMSDRSIDEASLRRVMFSHAKKRIFLCDQSKLGKRYFYNMGNLSEVDACICDAPLPEELLRLLARQKKNT